MQEPEKRKRYGNTRASDSAKLLSRNDKEKQKKTETETEKNSNHSNDRHAKGSKHAGLHDSYLEKEESKKVRGLF